MSDERKARRLRINGTHSNCINKGKPERMISGSVFFFCSQNQVTLDRVDHSVSNAVFKFTHLIRWDNTYAVSPYI